MILNEVVDLIMKNFSLIIHVILVIVVPLIILRIITKLLTKLNESSSVDENIFKTTSNIIHYLAYISIFLGLLGVLGIDLQSVIVSLGLVSVALSLAAKDTLSNVISGITIMVEKKFVVGDVIGIDGQIGQVVKIGLKSVSLYMRKQVIVVPNVLFTTKPFINYTKDGTFRVSFDVYLLNKYDLSEKIKEISNVLEKSDLILDNPKYQVVANAITTEGVHVIVRFYIDDPLKDVVTRSQLISQIKSEVLIEDIE